MALSIVFVAAVAGSYKATLTRVSDGYFWSASTTAWVSSAPAYSDQAIALTEGTGELIGRYVANVTGLGDAGYIDIAIHDVGDSDSVVGEGSAYVMGGNEVPANEGHKLANDGLDEILAPDGTTDLKTALFKGMVPLIGTLTGAAGTTNVFVGLGYTLTATTDADGNRSAVVFT